MVKYTTVLLHLVQLYSRAKRGDASSFVSGGREASLNSPGCRTTLQEVRKGEEIAAASCKNPNVFSPTPEKKRGRIL